MGNPTLVVPADILDPMSDAELAAYAGLSFADLEDYSELFIPERVDAYWWGRFFQRAILALKKASVISPSYTQVYNCDAGLAVGDPVYISADNTLAKADATDATKCKVVGWVRSKPTTTFCYLDHYRYLYGLTGLTFAADVFLQDDSSYGATPGTVPAIVAKAISATEALGSVAAKDNSKLPLAGGTMSGDIDLNDHALSNVGLLSMVTGSNKKIGAAVLVAGTVTVANTAITGNSFILMSVNAPGGTQGFLSYVTNPGVGFTINSTDVSDTSTIVYVIVEAI